MTRRPTPDNVDSFLAAVGTPRAHTAAGAELDDAAFLSAVGQRILAARKRCRMSRRLLAEQSGRSERYILQIEVGKGNISLLVLRAIASSLGTTPLDLIEERAPSPLDPLASRLNPAELDTAHALLTRHFSTQGAPNRDHRIALIGIQAAGKTTIGRAIAARRGVPLIELDAAIRQSIGGNPRDTIEHLLAATEAAVIAVPGSFATTPAIFNVLRRSCRVIWLRATPEEHLRRAGLLEGLSALDRSRAIASLATLVAVHEPLLLRADATVDTTNLTEAAAIEALERFLG